MRYDKEKVKRSRKYRNIKRRREPKGEKEDIKIQKKGKTGRKGRNKKYTIIHHLVSRTPSPFLFFVFVFAP